MNQVIVRPHVAGINTLEERDKTGSTQIPLYQHARCQCDALTVPSGRQDHVARQMGDVVLAGHPHVMRGEPDVELVAALLQHPGKAREVGRGLEPHPLNERRRGDNDKARGDKKLRLQPRPLTGTEADRDVVILAPEID